MIKLRSQKPRNRSSAKSIIAILIALAYFSIAVPAGVSAGSTVRGRIDRRYANNRTYPAANVRVTVYNPSAGRSSPAYTGANGLYYLYNIPAGNYYLEIWLSEKPVVYSIRVNNQAYTDITPILLP